MSFCLQQYIASTRAWKEAYIIILCRNMHSSKSVWKIAASLETAKQACALNLIHIAENRSSFVCAISFVLRNKAFWIKAENTQKGKINCYAPLP